MTTNKDNHILPCKHCGSAPIITKFKRKSGAGMWGNEYYLVTCTPECNAEQTRLRNELADFEAKQKAIIEWNGQQE